MRRCVCPYLKFSGEEGVKPGLMAAATSVIPLRIQELIGGMDGAGLEQFGQFTKLVKGEVEVFLTPPRTCVVLRRPQQGIREQRIALFPNLALAVHHMVPSGAAPRYLMDAH